MEPRERERGCHTDLDRGHDKGGGGELSWVQEFENGRFPLPFSRIGEEGERGRSQGGVSEGSR